MITTSRTELAKLAAIRVLGTFPEALQAVRDALLEARRTGPKELYDTTQYTAVRSD